jgi:probable O-glycosylation ligase (exosortase A-associated)
MRDIAIVAAVLGSIPLIFRRPFVGMLLWTWITVGVLHQEAWGFSRSFPINLIVALVTILAWFFSKERKLPPSGSIYWLFIVFLLWVTFSSFFAFNPSWSWQFWDRCWKTVFFGLFAAAMANSKVRLHALMWVTVIALFYYGVKGGLFTILTGGHYHVFGPPNSPIGDNNALALALLMSLPLANYLRMQTSAKWLQYGIFAAMLLTVVAVIGSYSRGAVLGLAAVAAAGIMRTRRRFLYFAFITALIVPSYYLMPDTFHQRVESISQAGTDDSFMGRIHAWQVAFYCAVDHFPVGVGFYGPQLKEVFHLYLPDEKAHAAHSIYFQVLGENGFVGLAIYLMIIAAAFIVSGRIRKMSRDISELRWAYEMASMFQISFVAFCVGGAALSMAYYDVFFLTAALLLPMEQIVRSTVVARGFVRADDRFSIGVPANV